MFYEQDAPKAPPSKKSPARVAAGQRNGKLAAGQKSPAGLAVSAQNAHKHGYYSRTFTTIGTEKQEIYNEIREALRAEYAPATIREHQLVEEIAQHNWLLNRNFNLENAYLNGCIANVILQEDAPDDAPINVVSTTVEGYKQAAAEEKVLVLLYRHRAQIQRDLLRATKTLDTLVEMRRKSNRFPSTAQVSFVEDPCFVTRSQAFRNLGILNPASNSHETNHETPNSRNEGNAQPEEPTHE